MIVVGRVRGCGGTNKELQVSADTNKGHERGKRGTLDKSVVLPRGGFLKLNTQIGEHRSPATARKGTWVGNLSQSQMGGVGGRKNQREIAVNHKKLKGA